MDEYVSDKILPYLTDYTHDDFKNIVNDGLQQYGKIYKKINIYNRNINIPLQKIWMFMPRVKIFKNIKLYTNTKNTFPLVVILGPNTGLIKKFYMYIKKIERSIQTIVKNITKKKVMQIKSSTRSAEGFPPLFNLQMPSIKNGDCYELKFQIYNSYGKRTSINSISQGTFAEAIIELSDVWISDKEFGINWNILQLQLFPEFNFSEFLFKDNVLDNTHTEKQEECYHCLYCPNAHIRTHVCANSFTDYNTQFIPAPPPPPPINIPIVPICRNTTTTDVDKKNKIVQEQPKGFAISVEDLSRIRLKPINKNKDDDIVPENGLEMLSSIRNNLKSN
jgi:hypothetical protein